MTNSITPPLRPPQIELTTRDHLAFDVLKTILSSPNTKPHIYPQQYARHSYDMVDAMLKERDK